MIFLASYAGPSPGDIEYFWLQMSLIPWHGLLGFAVIIFVTIALTVASIRQAHCPISCASTKCQFKLLIGANLLWATFLMVEQISYSLLNSIQANAPPMTKAFHIMESFVMLTPPMALGLLIWIFILACLFTLARFASQSKATVAS